MSIQELKDRLQDVPGIENLTMRLEGGQQVFSVGGAFAAVHPLATDAEIEAAIRSVAIVKEVNTINALAASSASLIPVVNINAPAAIPGGAKPMSTGASHASVSLKAMMEAHKAKIAKMLEDGLANVQAGFDKQVQGATAVATLGAKVQADGDDLLATVGQFTNDLGLSE